MQLWINFFTVITVTDELNAFKVFETLNACGVRLSSTDLLKNYLFSVVHGEEPHELEMKTLEERSLKLSDKPLSQKQRLFCFFRQTLSHL